MRTGLCILCQTLFPGAMVLGALKEAQPTHCHGNGDQPGISGLIGSGFHCSCECRSNPPENGSDLPQYDGTNDVPA